MLLCHGSPGTGGINGILLSDEWLSSIHQDEHCTILKLAHFFDLRHKIRESIPPLLISKNAGIINERIRCLLITCISYYLVALDNNLIIELVPPTHFIQNPESCVPFKAGIIGKLLIVRHFLKE